MGGCILSQVKSRTSLKPHQVKRDSQEYVQQLQTFPSVLQESSKINQNKDPTQQVYSLTKKKKQDIFLNTITSPEKQLSNQKKHQKQHGAEAQKIEEQKINIDIGQQNNDEDLMQLMQAQNLRSSIIKLGSKKKRNNEDNKNKEGNKRKEEEAVQEVNQDLAIEEFQKEDIFEGRIVEEEYFSRILIYTENVSMEFSLPKCRAGPLIVPLINYHAYLL